MNNIYYIAPIGKTLQSNLDPIEIKDEIKKFSEKFFDGYNEQVHFGGFWGNNSIPSPDEKISISCNAVEEVNGNIVWVISVR